MELLTILTTASKVIGTVNTLRRFVEDDLATFLTSMGEEAAQAAAKPLQHMKGSTNPSRQVTLALGSLQTAYQVFAIPKGWRSWALDDHDRAWHNERQCIYAILIGLCHQYLNAPELAKAYLLKARDHFDQYAQAYLSEHDGWTYEATAGAWSYYIYDVDGAYRERKKIASERARMEQIIKRGLKGSFLLLSSRSVGYS